MAYNMVVYILILTLYFDVHSTSGAKPIIESALFTCGYALFKQEEIAMLFPPSDISMANIQNVTAAELIHRNGLQSFCAQVGTYSACVKENIFYFPMDELVKRYMDVGNLERYFKFFCKHSKMIADQFHCTRISVWGRRCAFGGVYGIIALVSRMIRFPSSQEEFCANMKYSINCRVNMQLAPCHRKYADVMEWVYRGLVSNYCV